MSSHSSRSSRQGERSNTFGNYLNLADQLKQSVEMTAANAVLKVKGPDLDKLAQEEMAHTITSLQLEIAFDNNLKELILQRTDIEPDRHLTRGQKNKFVMIRTLCVVFYFLVVPYC